MAIATDHFDPDDGSDAARAAMLATSKAAAELGAHTGARELLESIAGYTDREDLVDSRRNAGVFLELIAACSRARSSIDGLETELVQRFRCSFVSGGATEELAARLGITGRAADVVLNRAAALEDYVEVHDALLAGTIDVRKADVFIEATATLPPGLARSVHEALLPDAPAFTPTQLRNRLRTAALAVDPSLMIERHERARKDRHVEMKPADDGMAYLTFYLTADAAVGAINTLDAIASRKNTDDDRTVGARRADAFTDIITQAMATGRTPSGESIPTQQGSPPRVVITIAQSTLDGRDDAPAFIAGYGPVAAPIARKVIAEPGGSRAGGAEGVGGAQPEGARVGGAEGVGGAQPEGARAGGAERGGSRDGGAGDSDGADRKAPGLTVREVSLDPRSGVVDPPAGASSLSTDGYAPGTMLREYISVRDQLCRFPGCQQPARRSQIDHIIPFDESKPAREQTVDVNLHVLCARHHQLKTSGAWSVTRDAQTGTSHWTSALGNAYVRAPEDLDPTNILRAVSEALARMKRRHPEPEFWSGDAPRYPGVARIGEPDRFGQYAASELAGQAADLAGSDPDPPPF